LLSLFFPVLDMEGPPEEMGESLELAAAAEAAAAEEPDGALVPADVKMEKGRDGEITNVITLERLKATEGLVACPGCGKEMRRTQMAIHMRNKKCESFLAEMKNMSPPPPPLLGRIKCPATDCQHVSPNMKALRKHYASKHSVKIVCSKCNIKKYGRSDALRKHERTCGTSRRRRRPAQLGQTRRRALPRRLAASAAALAPLRSRAARGARRAALTRAQAWR